MIRPPKNVGKLTDVGVVHDDVLVDILGGGLANALGQAHGRDACAWALGRQHLACQHRALRDRNGRHHRLGQPGWGGGVVCIMLATLTHTIPWGAIAYQQ